MIYTYFPDDEFEAQSTKIAIKLSQMPTKGLALTKKLFNQSMNNDLNDQLDLEKRYQIQASETHDYQEGVNAFLEKRKPHFNGN
jgi:2-(1,2-epoxy-1,2-dihydrophenyl)acetyl-CoA isomerase